MGISFLLRNRAAYPYRRIQDLAREEDRTPEENVIEPNEGSVE